MEWESMGWINLDKQNDIWQSLANTALEFRVPKNVEHFLAMRVGRSVKTQLSK